MYDNVGYQMGINLKPNSGELNEKNESLCDAVIIFCVSG